MTAFGTRRLLSGCLLLGIGLAGCASTVPAAHVLADRSTVVVVDSLARVAAQFGRVTNSPALFHGPGARGTTLVCPHVAASRMSAAMLRR